eukprot:4532373-Amphidinium_carterae.1
MHIERPANQQIVSVAVNSPKKVYKVTTSTDFYPFLLRSWCCTVSCHHKTLGIQNVAFNLNNNKLTWQIVWDVRRQQRLCR